MQRLVTIIREDLIPGYQIAQTVHAVAELCMYNHSACLKWHQDSNYVLALGTPTQDMLMAFSKELWKIGIKFNTFYEPDIQEITSIAFLSTPETDTLTKGMPLAGKTSGLKSKPGKVEREQ